MYIYSNSIHLKKSKRKTTMRNGKFGCAVWGCGWVASGHIAAYLKNNDGTLEDFLDNNIFCDAPGTKLDPEDADVAGFKAYLDRFIAGLPVEKAAIETL